MVAIPHYTGGTSRCSKRGTRAREVEPRLTREIQQLTREKEQATREKEKVTKENEWIGARPTVE